MNLHKEMGWAGLKWEAQQESSELAVWMLVLDFPIVGKEPQYTFDSKMIPIYQ